MTFVERVTRQSERVWQDDILPALHQYIAIPNVSAAFDTAWKANGHMDRAVELVATWCRDRRVAGLQVDVVELPGRSPLIVMEIPAFGDGSGDDTVLLYGHLDKQPEMTGWRDGLGPWTPVLEGDRLYGRGGADDGYSAFASLAAIEAVQANGGSHTRCVVIIEASEESGSPDLPAYVDLLEDRLGTPSLVVCLDSGCATYDRMWVTTSLRGLLGLTLTVDVLDNGLHSGDASGIVPSSFRIIRQLLDRIEDAATGKVLIPAMHAEIPSDRLAEAAATAVALGGRPSDEYHFAGDTEPMAHDAVEQFLNRTWRPSLSYIAADGFPPSSRAGNVLRPTTSVRLSFRLPPTVDANVAREQTEALLLSDPPSKARVQISHVEAASGWNAPAFAPWLSASLAGASTATFGQRALSEGEGGSIPFMGMLGDRFPDAQFVITGVLGPESNAHGPNEYLHVPSAKAVTSALAIVLHDHARRA